MLQVTVTISGSKETQQKLQKLGRSLFMLKASMEAIGEDLEDYYGNRAFASQGGVFGSRWPSLNRGYARQKAKRYPGRSVLVKTGRLQKGFTHDANQTSVTISNPVPYFKYHQSTAPRRRLPRRQMLGINDAVRQIVQYRINNGIKTKLREAGLNG